MREAGLSLASLEFKTFPCPHTKLRQQTGDAKMAAKSMAEETRAWSNSSFLHVRFDSLLFVSSMAFDMFFVVRMQLGCWVPPF